MTFERYAPKVGTDTSKPFKNTKQREPRARATLHAHPYTHLHTCLFALGSECTKCEALRESSQAATREQASKQASKQAKRQVMPSKACKASGASKLWHQRASDATKQALISNGSAASVDLHVRICTLATLTLLISARFTVTPQLYLRAFVR